MEPLPFADASFDGVYHSHLLEHLPRDRALPFLQECRRVLKPGGVLRLAIPNLEAMARLYLYVLEDAWRCDEEALAHHRWLVMEFYDQATRENTGGAMLAELRDDACPLAWFRLGSDAANIRQLPPPAPPTWRDRVRGWLIGSWRERLVRWLLGPEYAVLQTGRFRRSGGAPLDVRPRLAACAVDASRLRPLPLHGADGERNSGLGELSSRCDTGGEVCKPDSLFVEARREHEP